MELLVYILSLQTHQELSLSTTLGNSFHLIFTKLSDKTICLFVFLTEYNITNKLNKKPMVCFVSEPIILTGINCCQQILLSFLFFPRDLLCVEKSALSIYSF